MKKTRWYKIEDGHVFIYDAPEKRYAQSMSIVSVRDLYYYYRKAFNLKALID